LLEERFPKALVVVSDDKRLIKAAEKKGCLQVGCLDLEFHLRDNSKPKEELHIPNICASFQEAIADVLVKKTLAAAGTSGVSQIVLAGGVSANQRLRDLMCSRGQKENIAVFLPPKEFCTDNAAMIAVAGYHLFKNRKQTPSTIDMDVYSRSQIHF